jgi:hypothetical protein
LCLQVKTEIEKLGLKVWIDIEAISGSSLESMANAIEDSICVLMCMTEKYKQSANCRLIELIYLANFLCYIVFFLEQRLNMLFN